ncbi:MAG: prepilin-type N-terminal cleavage/methylation domain-containing protein [Sulfuricurvum sp.]|nr:prepilin-type N-terminal cleavage/methylation domain-containing protein [Sulfuricurvum sp.]MDP3023343.1 prepilin-type N-terminal cleavage/methylation domain-containing protein [Sulfuricurvum sp.]MDP3119448.1 prepilin-type N-terminal cleavage/methylation domain-containing protein [Sulfuricurvum sp.]
MAHSKGFSLIETLVAVTIASIATMALMRVVSYASTISSNALNRFDSSVLMSLALENIEEAQSTSISDALNKRYLIDHALIREELQAATYEILLLPKENITPFTNGMGSSSLFDSLYVQKVMIKSSQETKSFFRITSNKQ